MIATRLPLPAMPAPREQRLRAALHERGWADVGLLLLVVVVTALMERAGIAANRRVAGLGERQRAVLLEALA